jgi:protein phosphatase
MNAHLKQVYGLSDIGLVRKNNEDVWGISENSDFFALADGMGGCQAGEIAASEIIANLLYAFNTLESDLKNSESYSPLLAFLNKSIVTANRVIYSLGKSSSCYRGMGTTICSYYIHKNFLLHAHVGDSRLYRFRNNRLEQLTEDHSIFAQALRDGHLKESDRKQFRYRHVLTKAVGTSERVSPSLGVRKIHEGDIYLICSDGLSDTVSNQQIEEALILFKDRPIKECAHYLVDLAKQNGGLDNITLVISEMSLYPTSARSNGETFSQNLLRQ